MNVNMNKDAELYVPYSTRHGAQVAARVPRLSPVSITAPVLSSRVSFICIQRYVISGIESVVK